MGMRRAAEEEFDFRSIEDRKGKVFVLLEGNVPVAHLGTIRRVVALGEG
jgi:hypothetical protein